VWLGLLFSSVFSIKVGEEFEEHLDRDLRELEAAQRTLKNMRSYQVEEVGGAGAGVLLVSSQCLLNFWSSARGPT